MRIHHMTLGVALVFIGLDLAAAGLNITIEARVAGRRQTSANGQNPPAFTVKRGETLSVQWTATNPAPGPTLSDVTMHTVLDRDTPGAQGKAGSNALYEGAVNLDFRSGERSSGNFRMPMVEPGNYVLRVETVGIRAKAGAESLATLKVIVQ
jgi:hypothetical protein